MVMAGNEILDEMYGSEFAPTKALYKYESDRVITYVVYRTGLELPFVCLRSNKPHVQASTKLEIVSKHSKESDAVKSCQN